MKNNFTKLISLILLLYSPAVTAITTVEFVNTELNTPVQSDNKIDTIAKEGNQDTSKINIRISPVKKEEVRLQSDRATIFLTLIATDDVSFISSIRDITGKVVKHFLPEESGSRQLYVGDLKPGVYILEMQISDEILILRFAKLSDKITTL